MLDDSEIRRRRERKRETSRLWRLKNLEAVRARNREGERKRRRNPEYLKKLKAYNSRPDVQARKRERRQAWLAIPENREKHRAKRREYKRRARERKQAGKVEALRLLDIFNRAWGHLLRSQKVTDCTADRDRLASVVLVVAQDRTGDPQQFAKQAIESFVGGA